MTLKRNSHMDAAVIGMADPLTFVDAYGNQGKIQQLIDLITLEEGDSTVANRFWLDKMAPPARDVLYKILKTLQASVDQTVFFANGGGPFVATTGWADGGTEAANNALSAAGDLLISTLTAGGGSDLQVYASFTSVVGIEYEIVFRNLTIMDALSMVVSNAAALSDPLASEAVDEVGGVGEDGVYDEVRLRFVATATTTYFGASAATTPADGVLFSVEEVTVNPIIPT